MNTTRMIAHALGAASLLLAAGANANPDEENGEAAAFWDGIYVLPMVAFTNPDDKRRLDDATGFDIGVGYKLSERFALEIDGTFTELDRDNGQTTDMTGFTLRGLAYLGSFLSDAFVSFGIGELSTDAQGMTGADYSGLHIEGGVGYVLPLKIGRYDFGLRADYRFRHNNGQAQSNTVEFDNAGLSDTIVRLGLNLPIGRRPPPPEPEPPEPVALLEPKPLCSDGIDNDSDGRIDHPADPGCDSPDDGDEIDPVACRDGVDNDGDGLVDYPEDKGCDSAEGVTEIGECRAAGVGQGLSLEGCEPGDVIVLRGVHFEFDRARLTPDAQQVLDTVAEALARHPDIRVELAGHTDARGGAAYNDRLSEERANAVRQYLIDAGIAADRMTTKGYGETRPVASNDTDEGRQRNRRTELLIVSDER